MGVSVRAFPKWNMGGAIPYTNTSMNEKKKKIKPDDHDH